MHSAAPVIADAGTRSGASDVVLSHQTERSILHAPNAAEFVPYAVGTRMRRATCSGVAWFAGYHLAVVNLYGGHLRIYRFHPGDGTQAEPARLELLHELAEAIICPEDVAVSPDGTLIAVTHASGELGVSLFHIDPDSLAPSPTVETIRPRIRGTVFHGVNFSPDSRHLVFTEITTPGFVEVVRLDSASRDRTCVLENQLAPLKPKSVAFSRDGCFAAVAMGLNGTPDRRALPSGGMLTIHSYDARNGIIERCPLAEFRAAGTWMAGLDMCTVLPAGPGAPYRVLVVDQGADAVLSFEFTAKDPTIVPAGAFAAGLSFPHSVDVSGDGQFAAIANYGDDTVRICRVTAARRTNSMRK
jgi:DNA-binding beta-propeller fold protein YncE